MRPYSIDKQSVKCTEHQQSYSHYQNTCPGHLHLVELVFVHYYINRYNN